MQLTQLKIRGLGTVPETGWIPIKPRVTIFRTSDDSTARCLQNAIQTINPPYDCREKHPFADYPTEIITASGHRKRIQSYRRTISFAVFSTPAPMVLELGSLTSALYETDRIEIGRRLDYSRWINFVELASSSRWSEVSADIRKLVDPASSLDILPEQVQQLIGTMKDTDRVKEESAQILDDWLSGLQNRVTDIQLVQSVREKVRRWALFNAARQVVEKRLPLFLSSDMAGLNATSGESIQIGAANSASSQPIMLLDFLHGSDTEVNRRLDSLHDPGLHPHQYLCFIGKHCRLQTGYEQAVVDEHNILAASGSAARPTR